MEALVTVLMTTYNEDEHILSESIDSILSQNFNDYEILIVVDNPENIQAIETINSFIRKDSRVRMVVNEKNVGLAMSLNRGISLINTKYIARMDADDIALNNRLKKQIDFLESNSDVGIVGCNVIYMNSDGETIANRGSIPTEYHDISFVMKNQNIMNHPTFVGKTEVFKKYQYRNLRYSQDYDLICRLLEDGVVIRNLPDYLLRYRVNPNVSDDKRTKQKITMHVIRKLYKRNNLQKSDIVNEVKKELKNTNRKRLLIAMKKYDTSLEKFKRGHRIQAMFVLLQASVRSRIMMSEFFNTVAYYFIKRKWV